MLWLAEISPKLVLKKSSFEFLDKESLVKINLDIENTGYLPTNITQRAIDADIASPVRVEIELKEAYLISGATRQTLVISKDHKIVNPKDKNQNIIWNML